MYRPVGLSTLSNYVQAVKLTDDAGSISQEAVPGRADKIVSSEEGY